MSMIRTDKETYSYKYLSSTGKAAVNGVHFALEEVMNASTDKDELEDLLDGSDDEIEADDETVEKIGKLVINDAAQRLVSLIRELVVSGIDSDDEFEKHKKEIDKQYAEMTIKPDCTLYDEEGYLFGTVKSVSDYTAVIAVNENPVFDDTESGEEKKMALSEVRKYYIRRPVPTMTEYSNGRKIEHYRYGGNIVTPIAD